MRYLLGKLISGYLFLSWQRVFFPPSCLLLSSLLGCIGIPASTVLSKRFCAILLVQRARGRWEGRRRSWYNAVFQHLSHGFSPYPLWRSERELCGTHHRESLFQESVEASVGFAGCFHGKQSAVRQMCARTRNLLNLILSRQPYVTERQWLVRQNRIIIVFFFPGYMESTNQTARACKPTARYLHPSQNIHRVCVCLVGVASRSPVDLVVLTQQGLETVRFRTGAARVPLGWFLAVPSPWNCYSAEVLLLPW